MGGGELRGWLCLVGLVLVAHAVSLGIRQLGGVRSASGNNDDADQYDKERFDSTPWEPIGRFKDVDTFVKHVPGSKLHAFRGTTFFEGVHISSAMSHFYDVSLASEWIDMLDVIREYSYPIPTQAAPSDLSDEKDRLTYDQEFYKQTRSARKLAPLTESLRDVDLVYEVMRLPWPVAPRDILLRREWNYDYDNRSVAVRYHSVEDPIRLPLKPGTVRAWSPHTLWVFRSTPKGTLVEIECLVDSRGSIPAVLINFFQRSFPSKALTAFRALVKKSKVPPHKRVQDW